MPFRTAVLVVGAPRSGTSAICHVLNKCGVTFGDPSKFVDPSVNAHNPVFFELTELNQLNEAMIERMGWSYRSFMALPLLRDFNSAMTDEFEERVSALVSQFDQDALFGLKDPRFCFTLPLWLSLLSRQGIRPRVLRTRRDHEAVASSNFQLSPELGIDYARRIARLSDAAADYFLRDLEYQDVDFDELRAGDMAAMRALADVAGLSLETVQQACDGVFQASLVHWQGTGHAAAPNRASEYESLAELTRAYGIRITGTEGESGTVAAREMDVPLASDESVAFEHGPVQIYFRTEDQPFSEAQSVTLPWPSKRWNERVSLNVPVVADYMRIDVNSAAGGYVVRQLLVDDESMEPLSTVISANGALYPLPDGALGLVANHSDPWIQVKVPVQAAQRLQIEIERTPPSEVAKRLFQDVAVERLLEALHQRISMTDDRAVEQVAKLHESIADEGQRVGGEVGALKALAQQLVGASSQTTQAQADLLQISARGVERLEEVNRSLDALKQWSEMSWWQRKKHKWSDGSRS